MSEVSSKLLAKSMKDLFSNLSNSSHYDQSFLETKNIRFYRQLDLLIKDHTNDRSSLSYRLKEDNNRTQSSSQEYLDLDILATKKAISIKETLHFDDYIPGEISRTQLLFENIYKDDAVIFKEAYQKCWLDLYRVNDVKNFIKFISISSDIEYSILQERADSLIIAGYAHIDPFVMEAAIRAIEKWQQPHLIGYLSQMRPSEIDWIEDYKSEVIEDLSLIL